MNSLNLSHIAPLLLYVMASMAHGDLGYTPPDADAVGGITGRIIAATPLQRVIAIEPFELKIYSATVDTRRGQFTFSGLPPGEYDLLIKSIGHVYEGIALTPIEEPLSDRSRTIQKICDEASPYLFKTEDYFHIKEVVRMAGHEQAVRALVMQVRTRKVVDPGGNPIKAMIRRLDFVDMVKTRQVWQIVTNRHLLRQEVPYDSKDAKLIFTYSPRLSGILVGDQVHQLGPIDLRKLPKVPRGGSGGGQSRFGTAKYAEKETGR